MIHTTDTTEDADVLESSVSLPLAAKLLGVSYSSITSLIRFGTITPIRVKGEPGSSDNFRLRPETVNELAGRNLMPPPVTISGIQFPGWVRAELARRQNMRSTRATRR